jgi:hypothetical protein
MKWIVDGERKEGVADWLTAKLPPITGCEGRGLVPLITKVPRHIRSNVPKLWDIKREVDLESFKLFGTLEGSRL